MVRPGKPPDGHQNDAALSFTAVRSQRRRWTFKIVEGHYIQGTGLLRDDADNPNRNGNGWFMLVVKTTFSF